VVVVVSWYSGIVVVLLRPEMEAKAANVPGNYKRQ